MKIALIIALAPKLLLLRNAMTTATMPVLSSKTPEGVAARAAYIDERDTPLMDLLAELYGRWLDEKGCEDFNEYVRVVVDKALECFPEAKMITFNKSFQLGMNLPSFPYRVVFYVNSKTGGWKSAKFGS